MSPELKLQTLLETIQRNGGSPGLVAHLREQGCTRFAAAVGDACREPIRQALTRHTRFDLASLTKPVVTATAIMYLVERGRLALDEPLAERLPEFAQADKARVTVRQCLTHTTGLPPFRCWYQHLRGRGPFWRAICAEPLLSAPGERRRYSDIGYLALGYLVEELTRQSLASFARQRIFAPLGLDQIGFQTVPPAAAPERERFAATEYDEHGRMKQGWVHDETAAALGGVAGHAGLFATADELGRFGDFLLGVHPVGANVLAPATLELMLQPHWTESSPRQGLGWWLAPDRQDGLGYLPGGDWIFGHTGFTGPAWWLDRRRKLSVVLLANAVHPRRELARRAWLREQFFDAVARWYY